MLQVPSYYGFPFPLPPPLSPRMNSIRGSRVFKRYLYEYTNECRLFYRDTFPPIFFFDATTATRKKRDIFRREIYEWTEYLSSRFVDRAHPLPHNLLQNRGIIVIKGKRAIERILSHYAAPLSPPPVLPRSSFIAAPCPEIDPIASDSNNNLINAFTRDFPYRSVNVKMCIRRTARYLTLL